MTKAEERALVLRDLFLESGWMAGPVNAHNVYDARLDVQLGSQGMVSIFVVRTGIVHLWSLIVGGSTEQEARKVLRAAGLGEWLR